MGKTVKLLLASAGIKNKSIENALVEMLGKPISESNALAIPTAAYGHPSVTPAHAYRFVAGLEPRTPMTELGWKSVGVLELTALPSIPRERWVGWVRDADALLANGGDALYLAHWMRESGLADLLPTLPNMVWAGISGGSMVMAPRIGEDFVAWKPPEGGDKALGLVDFAIFPHVDHPAAEQWAATMDVPCYALDDESAVAVIDGKVEVISEGNWRLFEP
jgi:dipeptidase E